MQLNVQSLPVWQHQNNPNIVNSHIFSTSDLTQGPLKIILNNTVKKMTLIFYESWDMTTELQDLICTINIQTICMNRKHEQTELGARKMHVFYLSRPQISRSLKYGCRLHTYCQPRENKKCTKYNSVTILLRCIFESRSRCRPMYYVYTARCIILPFSTCLTVYYNYDY